MMRPQPRSTIASHTCLVMLKHESRLVCITESQPSRSILPKVMSRVIPALLISTSTGPSSATICVTQLTQLSQSATSQGVEVVTLFTHFPEPALRPGVARRAGGDDCVAERRE